MRAWVIQLYKTIIVSYILNFILLIEETGNLKILNNLLAKDQFYLLLCFLWI